MWTRKLLGIGFVAGVCLLVGTAIPAQSLAGDLECLLCHQWPEWDGQQWVTVHCFDTTTGEQCAQQQGEMCRACGDESVCHDCKEPDGQGIWEGECHARCSPPFAAVRRIDQIVADAKAAVVAGSFHSSIQQLAMAIQADPVSLAYDHETEILSLRNCAGVAISHWQVPGDHEIPGNDTVESAE